MTPWHPRRVPEEVYRTLRYPRRARELDRILPKVADDRDHDTRGEIGMADDKRMGLDALVYLSEVSERPAAGDLSTGVTISVLGGEVTSAGALALADIFAKRVHEAYEELEGLCAQTGDDPARQIGYGKLLEMARNGQDAARRNPTDVPGFLSSIYGNADARSVGMELASSYSDSLKLALQEREGIRGRIAQMKAEGTDWSQEGGPLDGMSDSARDWDEMIAAAEAAERRPDAPSEGAEAANEVSPSDSASPAIVSQREPMGVIEHASAPSDDAEEASRPAPTDADTQARPQADVPRPSTNHETNPASKMNFPGLAPRAPRAEEHKPGPAGEEAPGAAAAWASARTSEVPSESARVAAEPASQEAEATPGEGADGAYGYVDGDEGSETIVIDTEADDGLPDEPAPIMEECDASDDRLLVRTVLRMVLSRAQDAIGMDVSLDLDQYADLYGLDHDVAAVRAHLLARIAAYARLGRI